MLSAAHTQRAVAPVRSRAQPRRLWVAAKVTTAPAAPPTAASPLVAEQPSYVQFEGTAVHFHSVIARLGRAKGTAEPRPAPAPVESPKAAPAAPAPPPKSSAPWAGLLGSLFGGAVAADPAHPHGPSTHGHITSVDDGTALSRAVIMFTAEWCGPCSLVYKELRQVTGRLEGRRPAAILVIDVEKNKELASELGVRSLPTLLYMGSSAARGPIFTQGPVSADLILDMLDRAEGFGGWDVKAKWLKL